MSKHTNPITIASTNKVERLTLAKQERLAVKAWRNAGQVGDAPATPNLDALNADYESGASTVKKSKKSKSENPRPDRAEGIVFMYNGKPVAHNFLARLAANLKMPVSDLRIFLAERGVAAPEMTTWAVEVEGASIGAVLPGDETPAILATVRTSRKAKSTDDGTTDPVPSTWEVRRVGARTYMVVRDGEQVGSVVDSARKARAIVVEAGGPAEVELVDVREDAA